VDSVNYTDTVGVPPAGRYDLAMIDTSILKFFIQDQTGLAANKWYLDAVGFAVD
jgi:hypothetical protein